jgi:pectate lyase
MEILTHKGFKPFDGFINQGKSTLIKFDLSTNETIDCTHNHKFLLSDGITFKEAKDIIVGDILFPKTTVLEKEYQWDDIEVFDALNVQDTQSY